MTHPQSTCLSRRTFLAGIGVAAIGAAASGCRPLSILLDPTPVTDPRDPGVIEPTLRMLVDAVVPGVPVDRPGAAALFFDRTYPLARYRAELARDLQARAMRRADAPFDALPRHARQAVLRDGLLEGGISGQLYAGAIFLAQASVFAGLAHPDGACPPIGFAGRGGLAPMAAQTYPEPAQFLALPRSRDGNPA